MYKKYNFPLNLFLILEHANISVYSSKYLLPNHYTLFINSSWLFILNQILKNEYFFNMSYLVDISGVDALKYNNITPDVNLFLKKNRILIFYMYYIYYLKLRLTVTTFYNFKKLTPIKSIDNIYKNAHWVERELGEMFNIAFSFKKDSRKLLLDYSKNEAPMLKDFNSDGLSDVFYNFFEDQVTFCNNELVEL
jgi:NADH:ubiquinone oxidoreductase subunit C